MKRVPIVTPEAVVWVPEDDLTPKERSQAASHLNYALGALGLRGVEGLREFEGVQLDGLPLATELDQLVALDEGGGFSFDVFYWDDSK